MANEEHVKILKQGVDVWNRWRREELTDIPDLSGVVVRGGFLEGFDFHLTNLINSKFFNVNLGKANFQGANLHSAVFKGSNLSFASFIAADLRNTYISNTNLYFSLFIKTFFFKTIFKTPKIGSTQFSSCDLSTVWGLETVEHRGPSNIDIHTIMNSKGKIPISFLKGCGVPQDIIDYIIPLSKDSVIEYYSCFISYSTKDDIFAERLKNDLEGEKVRCWYFPEDAKWGKDIYDNIEQAIRSYDKLIIICSKNSLNSEPVLREIDRGLQKEKRERERHKPTKRVLFPIAIDGYFFDEWEHYLKPDLQRIVVGDFRGWKDPGKYRKAFDRLLAGLNKE